MWWLAHAQPTVGAARGKWRAGSHMHASVGYDHTVPHSNPYASYTPCGFAPGTRQACSTPKRVLTVDNGSHFDKVLNQQAVEERLIAVLLERGKGVREQQAGRQAGRSGTQLTARQGDGMC